MIEVQNVATISPNIIRVTFKNLDHFDIFCKDGDRIVDVIKDINTHMSALLGSSEAP